MKSAVLNSFILTLNLGIWGLNSLILTGTINLSAKGGVPVSILSEPDRVRLTVNGKPWTTDDGDQGWIQTPSTIFLPEGQHKVSIERPGYTSHSFKILASNGDSPEIKAELEQQDESFIEGEFTASDDLLDSMILVIDSGLAVGPPPLRVDDLTTGSHSLELRWTGINGIRKKPYRCTFNALVTNGNNQFKINITRSGKKLRIPGCKRAPNI